MLTAHTREIDDIERAVAEILEQLQLDERLLRCSVGLLAFHQNFLETDVVKAVSAALPFDSIGGTTSNLAVPGDLGDLLLTVTVLTSDDIEFRAGAVLLEDDPGASIRALYAELAPHAGEKPALLLTVAPVMGSIGGDDFVEVLDAASGGVPVFGSLSIGVRNDLSDIATCMNGRHHMTLFTLIAVFGDIKPEFYHTSIPDDRVIHQNAVITRSEKNLIQSINGLRALDYLESIGLADNGSIAAGIASIPFVLTPDDGTRLVRAAYRATPEGYIAAIGSVPQGVSIGFSGCNAEFVLSSARESIAEAIAASGRENALIVSCESRKWTLGVRPTAEMLEVTNLLDTLLPYRIIYAAGELCPVNNHSGHPVNTFQNFSMIACVL
jgi:hypothetical protein